VLKAQDTMNFGQNHQKPSNLQIFSFRIASLDRRIAILRQRIAIRNCRKVSLGLRDAQFHYRSMIRQSRILALDRCSGLRELRIVTPQSYAKCT
jgi:hypothetical protein